MARAALLAAAVACALGGCGTMRNLGPGEGAASALRKVYGGVGADLECLGGLLGSIASSVEKPRWHLLSVKWSVADGVDSTWQMAGALWITAVDIPLCVVLDTLTLPVTIPATLAMPPGKKQDGDGAPTPAGPSAGSPACPDPLLADSSTRMPPRSQARTGPE